MDDSYRCNIIIVYYQEYVLRWEIAKQIMPIVVIIDGENKKEHEYLIPKTKVDHYDEDEVYFNISKTSLKEFEI